MKRIIAPAETRPNCEDSSFMSAFRCNSSLALGCACNHIPRYFDLVISGMIKPRWRKSSRTG